MKYLRPRSVDSGLVTVLLVSDAELDALIESIDATLRYSADGEILALKKLRAELRTARRAL